MTRRSKPPAQQPLLPADALPCVWMSAGLMTYRLCDREYDCDHCPLDAAMRGLTPEAAAAPGRETEPLTGETEDAAEATPPEWTFVEDRLFHPGHGWAQQLSPIRVRCGVDEFAARLLERVHAVVLPAPATAVQQGRIAYWVVDGAQLVPLRSPVTGSVERINQGVQLHPELLASSPYADGWLMEVRVMGSLDRQPNLLTATDQARHTREQLRRFCRRWAHDAAVHREVGRTMPDGGERITDLRRLFGEMRFRKLVFSVLK